MRRAASARRRSCSYPVSARRRCCCEHGINVVHELPGVGENLQDHLQLRTVFKVRNAVTLNQRANSMVGKMMMGLEYAFFRTGPLTMAPSQLGGFTRSSSEHATPNIEFHVQPLSLDKFGDPLHRFPAFTASVCNLRPTSRGFVRIKSPDPLAAPVIQCRYLSTHEDRTVAADALRLTRRIAAQPALERYAPEEFLPGAQFQSDDDLARIAGDIGTTIFHPVGTCRMGATDDASAVVDSRLRVRGVSGLARRRRIDHADHYFGQHQLAHFDDCRARRRDDSR